MQVDWGVVGVWLMVVSLVAIVIEGVLAAVWGLRLQRRAEALQARLQDEQGRTQAEIERLRLAVAETAVLWQPYARLFRWLRHPITIALFQSFARRRAAAR